MTKVTGFGGAFLRANDPKALYVWYEQHLGIASPNGSFVFSKDAQRAPIAGAFFSKSADYFRSPSLRCSIFRSTIWMPSSTSSHRLAYR
jgi:hypothetical protein